jgi:conjugal transfer pilus assembly protein TraB
LAVIPGDTGKTGYIRGVKPNLVVTSDGGDVTYLNSSKSSTSKFNELNSTGKFRAQKSYIPTGTFFRAVLLGGLDAPTGGESQNANPHPVLMEITNLAQLPNSVRMNFKKCFVTGTGYGDLSSERAMIRTEQMSCVGTDGRALDIPIKGWVAGDDGKTGVRGRLVSKQGAVLKNALIAGTLSGIGSALSAGATTTTTNGLGSVSSISTGKQVQNALGAGANSAFDRLAQYYVKLADKMFPVIEVDAGRTVDIVLLKGFQIGDE